MTDLIDLHKKIQDCEGYKIHQKLRSLNNTEQIFYGNFVELHSIDKYIKEHPEIIYVKNRDKTDKFQIELARRMHNYLASVKSLVDHTRRLKKHFNFSKKNNDNYDLKREELLGKSEFYFVQQLREYVQHVELLPTGFEFRIDRKDGKDSELITLILFKEGLIGYDGWKSESRSYLKNSIEKIDLISLVSDYTVAINKFYKWFYLEVEMKHKEELVEFEKLAKEYEKYLPKG
ncbi:MAG: hypothetical protein COV78_04820 [Candidatus Pacebacteria bacterium CG11_big_fil_rev_8_21_14_0_20_34_55]|nr:MAG: hypothetical protein COV78_04820 [Candidatus Pacebacteria bacterium CG11_big_fil_rev_8_21_14_0_20_34_55]